MKVKLLKKVRRRFEIIHMPNGFISSYGDRLQGNLFKLIDKQDKYGFFTTYAYVSRLTGEDKHNTEAECIYYLKSLIISKLRSEGHRGVKDKKIILSAKKIWHI